MARRNRRTIRRRRRRVQPSGVTEVIVSNLLIGAITNIDSSHFSNIPKYSIWRPRRISVQAVYPGAIAPACIQIIMYNSSAERVSCSPVRMLNASRTTVSCGYPRSAEWFSPISSGKENVFDINIVCTGKATTDRIGVVITVHIITKSEVPAAACPAMPRVPIHNVLKDTYPGDDDNPPSCSSFELA